MYVKRETLSIARRSYRDASTVALRCKSSCVIYLPADQLMPHTAFFFLLLLDEWDGWASVAVRPKLFSWPGLFLGAFLLLYTSPAATVQEWNHLTFRQRIFQRIKRPAPMLFNSKGRRPVSVIRPSALHFTAPETERPVSSIINQEKKTERK